VYVDEFDIIELPFKANFSKADNAVNPTSTLTTLVQRQQGDNQPYFGLVMYDWYVAATIKIPQSTLRFRIVEYLQTFTGSLSMQIYFLPL
jgi:hypothetical protein